MGAIERTGMVASGMPNLGDGWPCGQRASWNGDLVATEPHLHKKRLESNFLRAMVSITYILPHPFSLLLLLRCTGNKRHIKRDRYVE